MAYTTHLDRLRELGLSITQAATWLDVSPEMLRGALEQDELPFWAEYCISGMETEYYDNPDLFTDVKYEDYLSGIKWTAVTARAASLLLIERAESNKGPITYKELDEELRRVDSSRKPGIRLTTYGNPLGLIGETIDAIRKEANDDTSSVSRSYSKLPPLECLVVTGSTGTPGQGIDGFLISYLKDLGLHEAEKELNENRNSVVERVLSDIRQWPDWTLLRELATQ